MKTRADLFLVRNGLAESRSKAAVLIAEGAVTYDGHVVTKSSELLDDEIADRIEITAICPYVSRGGDKLAGALEKFSISPLGMVTADIGASTGGFTDCLLQNGAIRVYAVDAGCGQLAASLCANNRVSNIEKCNARYPLTNVIPEPCDLVVSDVSFISQTLILPNIPAILRENGLYIPLVKPQFECGSAALNKKGIVKDKKMHGFAIRRVIDAALAAGLSVRSVTVSPITGGDGNREFLLLCEKGTTPRCDVNDYEIRRITET